MKKVNFSETFAACDLKVGRFRHVIQLMKVLWILIAFKKFVIASIDKSIHTVVTLIQSNALTLSPVIKNRNR